jgi:hypothetical protein
LNNEVLNLVRESAERIHRLRQFKLLTDLLKKDEKYLIGSLAGLRRIGKVVLDDSGGYYSLKYCKNDKGVKLLMILKHVLKSARKRLRSRDSRLTAARRSG